VIVLIFRINNSLCFRNRLLEFDKASARVRLIIAIWKENWRVDWRRDW
jgi:hypothetical protein